MAANKLKYSKLSVELRAYLEQIIGDPPFEMIPMLQASGMLSE